jgi:hypothetical protein
MLEASTHILMCFRFTPQQLLLLWCNGTGDVAAATAAPSSSSTQQSVL